MPEYDEEGYGGASPLAVVGMPDQYTTEEALQYARKVLRNTVDQPTDYGAQDYMKRIKSQADKARFALRNARKALADAKYSNSEAWLAASGALGAPTKTGRFGEALGRVGPAIAGPMARKRQWQEGRDKQLLDLDLLLANSDDEELAAQLKLMELRQKRDTDLSKEALKIIGRQVKGANPDKKLEDKGQEALDRAFATDYAEFMQTGAAEYAKNINELKNAHKRLSEQDNLTGPVIGTIAGLKLPFIGNVGKVVQDIFYPQSADTQELVESTIQRSLRQILGSQFTKEEGERLISRVYNPRLDESVNAKRVQRLLEQLQRAYDSKIEASNYFREHRGTLRGFEGQYNFTTDDLWTDEDDQIGKEEQADSDEPKYTPDPRKPPISLEALIPAGEDPGFAEGGPVDMGATDYDGQMYEEEGKVPQVMPDGQVIYVPPGYSYEKTLNYYRRAMQESGTPLDEPQDAPQESPAIDMPAEDVIQVAGSDPGMLSALGYGAAGAAGTRAGVGLSHWLADRIPGHKVSNAESRVLQVLENEGLNPTEWAKLVTQARRLGVPVTGIDMGGLETRALAEHSMDPNNPVTREVYRDTLARQRGARGRVEDQVNQALKPDDYFELEKKLLKQMQEDSGEAYAELYKQFPYLKSEQLMQLMNTPSGKKAVKEAVKAIRDRPGATLGKQDALGMVTKPSLEFLDQVKQELDDLINAEEMQGGVYTATGKGRRMRALRKALRDEMDTLTTDPKTKESAYKTARDTHSGGLEIRDALRFGRDEFMKKTPKELEEALKDMNFSERDALRTGVAQNLFEQIGKTGSRQNPAEKVFDTKDAQARLKLLFDKPKEFEIFKAALELEAKIFEESKSTITRGRNKLTSKNEAFDSVAHRTAKNIPYNPFSLRSWAINYLRRAKPIKTDEAEEVLKILRTSDPKDLAKIEKNLSSKFGRAAARKGRKAKGAILGGAIGAAFPFVQDWMNDEEEPVKKAKGGLVRRRKPTWRRVAEGVIDGTLGTDSDLTSLSARLG